MAQKKKSGSQKSISSRAARRKPPKAKTPSTAKSREKSRNKAAEQALWESEENLKLFIEHAPAAIAMFDREMRYLAVSRRWMMDYGLTGSNIIGRSHYEVFPEIPERWKEVHRRCLAGEVVREDQDRFDRFDGTTQWLQWEVRPWYAAGQVGGIVMFTDDVTTRVQSEERLEYLASFPQLNPHPVLEIDINKEITFANPAAYSVLAALGRNRGDIKELVPADLEDCIAKWDRKSRGIIHREVRVADQFFTATAHLIPDLKAARVYLFDITERKRAEDALQQSEARQRAIFDNSPAVIYVKNLNGRYLFVNRRAVDQMKRMNITADPLGRTDRDLFPPALAESFIADDEEIIRTRTAKASEEIIAQPDGAHAFIEHKFPLLDASGEPYALAGIVMDITERKRTEEVLRKSEEQFRRAIEEAPIPVIMHAEDGEVLQISRTWTELTGYSTEDIRTFGEWTTHAVYGEGADQVRDYIRAIFTSSSSSSSSSSSKVEFAVRTKTGEVRHWSFSASVPGQLADGRRYVVGMALDITERKRAEETLQELNAELEQRVRQRTRFYSVLAGVNEAIVRRRERQPLLEAVCRIIVETGGFRLAWIGLLDRETREVRPAASAGVSSYLDGLRVVAADVPEGRGPTGRAIAEGRHVINLDFETTENMAPWRERARNHDIRSSSAFPLFERGALVGALTIYSDQPHFFKDEEIALLDTLANNLSFALEAMALEQERKTMEEQLRSSYAEAEDLYNNAPCGYHSLDRNGLIIRINDTELKWLGYSREEVVGKKHIYDFYTPEGVTKFHETFPAFLERGSVRDIEIELVRRDGTVMQVLLTATALLDPEGKFLMSRSMNFDISARKQAEREARLLAAALESAADAVVITEPEQGEIWYVNAAFEQMTGYTHEEVAGQSLHILDSGRHDQAFYEAMREALHRTGQWQGRLISKKKNGTLYFEECTFSAVRDRTGNIINYISVKRDITEKLRMESIAESVSQLDNIGAVFAGVRHEIGNPINNAKLMLNLLQLKLDDFPRERVRSYVDNALTEIGRVEDLLKTLRTFNLFEKTEVTDVATGPLLASFQSIVAEDLKARGIGFSVQIFPGAEQVRADARALQQVLLNLTTNAADAVAGSSEPGIAITLSRDGDSVLIRLSDNGNGMSDAQLATLFKPFRTTKKNGTGLGLVIVKKMLTSMNGTIDFESSQGSGTSVNVRLPAGSPTGNR
jgi:PAS domain S-box-containing protein